MAAAAAASGIHRRYAHRGARARPRPAPDGRVDSEMRPGPGALAARTRTSAQAPVPKEMQRRPARHLAPESGVGVVGIDDRRRVVRQVLRTALPLPAQLLRCCRIPSRWAGAHCVIAPTDGRAKRGERGNLAAMVRAHLHHGGAVPPPSSNSVSGTPISLLRLPRVAEHRAPGAQDRGDHLLDRGLAVAAGDADQDQLAEATPPRRRELSEGANRIPRENERDGDIRRTLDQGRRRTAPAGAFDEIVSVEARAAHRDEQRARGDRARIGADAVKRDVLAGRAQTERRGGFAETHPDHRQPSSACPATAASLNGSRSPSHS